jgi:hypothetical protein
MRRLAASIRLVTAGIAVCRRCVPFRATVLDALVLASAHQELDDCGNNPAECEPQANGGFGWDAIAWANPSKRSSDRLLPVPNGSVDALGSGAVRNLERLIVAGKDDVKLVGCHVEDFGAKLVQGKYNFFHMIEDVSHDGIFHECYARIETDVSCLCRTAITGCGNLPGD